MTSLRTNREAKPVLELRLPESLLNLCPTDYLFSLRSGFDQIHVIFLHVVVCELYVALNRTLLVQH